MELSLDQALQKGIEAHKAGKAQEADRYYKAILKANAKHPDANHNMGVLAVGIGKVEAALPFFKTAVEANPSVVQFWLSYLDTLIKLDRVTEARTVLDQAKSNGVKSEAFNRLENSLNKRPSAEGSKVVNPSQDQLQPLISLYNQGQLQPALDQALQLLNEFPSSTVLHNIYGAVNAGLQKYDEAVSAYKHAIIINPNYPGAYNNMGAALKEQGKFKEAIKAYNNALSIKPDYADAYYNMGIILKEQGKLEEALEAYTKALTINPDYAEAYYNMGIILNEQDKLEEALEAYKKALAFKPDYAKAYNNIGNTLQGQGKLEEAIEAYKKALSIKRDYAETQNNMGVTLKDQGKIDEAIEAFTKALSIKPDYAEAHRNLSSVKKYTTDDKQFLQVKELYGTVDLEDDAKCNLSFALAKMYEGIGELDRAFQHLSEGNALRKKLLNYSIEQDKKLFYYLKKLQPKILKNSLKVKEASTDITPIFILGMPRSGTTLIEQIVSSHSEVVGTGELNYISQFGLNLSVEPEAINATAISKFRESYLSKLSKVSDGKHLLTDKTPHNFLFIPLICAAFPESKIIHVQRNAAATCWSNFKQYFVSDFLGYCHDLKDVVAYYNLYTEMMKLWQSQYGERIYNLNYESLTTDQENQSRKLMKHLALDWEKACLSPHKNKRSVRTASQQQVRQKVYQGSSEAWRKYEPFLNGAFDSFPSL